MRPIVRRLADLEEFRNSCGFHRDLLSAADCAAVSVAIVRIDRAERHHHQRSIEIYYVLEGEGTIELDGEEITLGPRTLVMIPPGVRHRADGRMNVLVISVPAFNPADQIPADDDI